MLLLLIVAATAAGGSWLLLLLLLVAAAAAAATAAARLLLLVLALPFCFAAAALLVCCCCCWLLASAQTLPTSTFRPPPSPRGWWCSAPKSYECTAAAFDVPALRCGDVPPVWPPCANKVPCDGQPLPSTKRSCWMDRFTMTTALWEHGWNHLIELQPMNHVFCSIICFRKMVVFELRRCATDGFRGFRSDPTGPASCAKRTKGSGPDHQVDEKT